MGPLEKKKTERFECSTGAFHGGSHVAQPLYGGSGSGEKRGVAPDAVGRSPLDDVALRGRPGILPSGAVRIYPRKFDLKASMRTDLRLRMPCLRLVVTGSVIGI